MPPAATSNARFGRTWVVAIVAAVAAAVAPAQADDATTPAPGDDLSVQQARLADRYERLETVMGRLAELSAGTDPERARVLREAIAQSREQDVNVRFESIVKLLQQERLAAAASSQTDLQKELDSLLALLLKADRTQQLQSERARIRQYLKELGRIIRLEKGVKARTEGGDDCKRLAGDQQQIADQTGKLGATINKAESDKRNEASDSGDTDSANGQPSKADGQPSGGQSPGQQSPSGGKPSDSGSQTPSPSAPSGGSPPAQGSQGSQGSGQGSPGGGESAPSDHEQPQQPAQQAAGRLQRAQQRMDEARRKLEKAQREGATDAQRHALQELEQAKADLERILRQLREEEMERTLTQLEARFRKMLDAQNRVYDGTVRLDRIPAAERGHDHEIESARLSREESLIVREADKALLLLHEEGSSVAFPEAVQQMREDMQQIVERLAALKVGQITQGLEEDVIAALEETIAALKQAMKDLEKSRTPPGQQPMAGQMAEPPLVDKLAELKMIRSLQMRINRRTQRYDEMIAGQRADTPELRKALERLAERQQRVYQATSDLSQGRND
jgi:hypothetical protein